MRGGYTPIKQQHTHTHKEESMSTYEIQVSNRFEAETVEDAVLQMVAWLDDNAAKAGYRVIFQQEESTFVDAEDMINRMNEGEIA
jgi:hypothetical protein